MTSKLHHATAEFPLIGRLHLIGDDAGRLLACSYADLSNDRRVRELGVADDGSQPDCLMPAIAQLEQYLAGQRTGFDLALDLRLLSAFQAEVLTTLAADVSYGQTTSYAELAQRIGRPAASRAVGRTLATNPICVILPCHRVLARDGALTGYAGGIAAKQALLRLEADQLTAG